MSTPAVEVQVAAPGTPGTAVNPPVTPTANARVAEAFGEPAPVAPVKPTMPAKKAAPAKAEPVTPPVAPPAKEAVAPVVPPKAEAPPASEFPEDKLSLPDTATEASKNGWKELKTIAKTLREQIAAKEAQIETYKKATPADTADLAAKEARLKAAEDRLAILDLQHHPEFTRQYVEPKKKAIATAAEVMGYQTTPKDAAELPALLGKPLKDFNAAVSEITKDMNSADAATVATSLREARTLHANEQAALAQSGQMREQLAAKTAQQQKQAFEAVATEITTSLKNIELTDAMSAEEKQGAVAYNQRLASLRQSAEKRAFGPITERDVARMAFDVEQLALMREHVIPGLERRFSAQNQIISELTAQLEALKGTRAPETLHGDVGTQPPKLTADQMIAKAYGPGR